MIKYIGKGVYKITDPEFEGQLDQKGLLIYINSLTIIKGEKQKGETV